MTDEELRTRLRGDLDRNEAHALLVLILGAAMMSFPESMRVPHAVVGWADEKAVVRVHFLEWMPPLLLVHIFAMMSTALADIVPMTIRFEVSCRRL